MGGLIGVFTGDTRSSDCISDDVERGRFRIYFF